jgi:hypothetical protein
MEVYELKLPILYSNTVCTEGILTHSLGNSLGNSAVVESHRLVTSSSIESFRN